MAKKGKTESQDAVKVTEKPLFSAKSGIDASLDALFSKSAGPVKNEPRKQNAPVKKVAIVAEEEDEDEEQDEDDDDNEDEDDNMEDDEELSELDDEEINALDDDDEAADKSEDEETQKDAVLDGQVVGVVDGEVAVNQPNHTIPDLEESTRKRKRKRDNEDLEDVYLTKLAREQDKEQAERDAERGIKRTKSGKEKPAGDAKEDDFVPPIHESLAGAGSSEPTSLEQAARTVFLGNVANTAITSKTARKTLLAHLSSILPSLPAATPPHKLESLRFRSTAFSSSVPKKAAFARKDIMDSTTKSTNAYAVYSTKTATREAAKQLNGTIVLDRHIRVDEVAHPQQLDHRRCVFVGNLGFVDDESAMAAAMAEADGEKRRVKKSPPGDAEEGLWREFGKAGKVESVRVVRDAKTRVGKGFAYVQFEDENAVEKALLFNEKKFPPLLPRKLRVVRAKKPSIARKTSSFYQEQDAKPAARRGGKQPPRDALSRATAESTSGRREAAEQSSMQGRAKKLLGRAGGAGVARDASNTAGTGANSGALGVKTSGAMSGIRKPESFVFEGHRASSTQGNRHLKLGGSGKKKAGKPRTRSAKRGGEWKKKGGK